MCRQGIRSVRLIFYRSETVATILSTVLGQTISERRRIRATDRHVWSRRKGDLTHAGDEYRKEESRWQPLRRAGRLCQTGHERYGQSHEGARRTTVSQ